MITIVTGPPACGKTRHKKHFQVHFGCAKAFDDYHAETQFKYLRDDLPEDILVLTTANPEAIHRWRWLQDKDFRIVRYEDAYAEITSATAGPWDYIPSTETRHLSEVGFRHLDGSFGLIALVGDDEAEVDDVGLAIQNANARVLATAQCLLREIKAAEAFIAGFEGDEQQLGIADILAGVRDVIARAEGRS